ncbi:MAG: type I secretion system permease/ATPase [Gammaproteobacteria bacterium]|nr:type I secretion system permease/ATPase [Gammaproteobacteria bacterium]
MAASGNDRSHPQDGELRRASAACGSAFRHAGAFSLVVNVLLLAPSLYMLAVYDRVLAAGSADTLLMLTLIVAYVFAIMGGLEWARGRLLVAASQRFEHLLGSRVFQAVFERALASDGRVASARPLDDLRELRQFLTGQALFACFDAPWLPIYLAVLFLFHPWFGLAGTACAVILVAAALANEAMTRRDLAAANREALEAAQYTQRNLRNAEAIAVMGMLPRVEERWGRRQQAMLAAQTRASARAGAVAAFVKTFRMLVQSLALGLGAWLALRREISPGMVIAGSILLGRALAPIDLLVAGWRGFGAAREAWRRLDELLAAVPAARTPMPLPAPAGHLALEDVVVAPDEAGPPILKGVSLEIAAGTCCAIIGASGAGKSTLLRTLLGLHVPARGSVRLDGADLATWDRAALGDHLGYVPQDVELLDGTIAENIARFGTVDADRVVAAAQAAGVHDLILRFPRGYDTPLVAGATNLSAGQQQRIAIARALYGEPAILALDEPNSNLDDAGEQALMATLLKSKRAGRTVVLVTHRPQLLNVADRIAVLADGRIALEGTREAVRAALTERMAQLRGGNGRLAGAPAPVEKVRA